jgi:hypothetical protein
MQANGAGVPVMFIAAILELNNAPRSANAAGNSIKSVPHSGTASKRL